MLSALSGLGGQPLTLKADPNVPLNTSGVSQDIRDRMRPGYKSSFEGYDFMKGFEDSEFYKKANPYQRDVVDFKFDGKDMRMNSSMAGALQQYLDSISKGDLMQSNLLYRGPLQPGMGPGGVTLRPGKPGISPLRPPNYDNLDEYQKGYLESDFYSPVSTMDVRPYTYKGKEMSGSGTYVSGFQDYLNSIGQGDLFSPTPPTIGFVQPLPNGTGTQMPIGGTPLPAPIQPTNPVTGNTSPIGGSQQDFDAYMNSYVNDLINQRIKNVFGGIMNSFN